MVEMVTESDLHYRETDSTQMEEIMKIEEQGNQCLVGVEHVHLQAEEEMIGSHLNHKDRVLKVKNNISIFTTRKKMMKRYFV